MKRLLLFVLCAFLCVGANAQNYRGKDAGVLVVSAGSLVERGGHVAMYYRPVRPDGSTDYFELDDIEIHYNPNFIFARSPDYTGHETGEVFIHHLKPGKYEIYTWRAQPPGYMGVSPKTDFSIPFTIKPGETTYIGNIAWYSRGGLEFLYVVSDKHERDIPLAQKREPNLPPVRVEVTDVSKFARPDLVAKEPE